MIKKFALNKIAVSTVCLVLLSMFYFLPTHENINTSISITNKGKENIVYLLDNDNYVSKVISYYDENSIEDLIRKKIEVLTNGSEELNDFKPLIPKNTKINSLKIEKDNIYIDFSNELLTINKYIEEKMIEAIVYSLTEINGINNIYISVEGKKLDDYDYPLTRNIGINKEYDITNLFDLNKITVFFSKKYDDVTYYVPITKVTNDKSSKVEIIIEELKSSVNAQKNLNSNITDDLKLIDYKYKDNEMTLTFNKQIDEHSKILIDESINENYDVNKINYEVKNNP